MHTVADLREQNSNTHKLALLLPDMNRILRRAVRAKYQSIIDGQDVYEQICIKLDHVERTAVTTPNGNMLSHILQQGDCNAPAMY